MAFVPAGKRARRDVFAGRSPIRKPPHPVV